MTGVREPVVLTGVAATTAFGRGTQPLLAAALAGAPAFAPVRRFDVARRRVAVAATLPGSPTLRDELADTTRQACDEAKLSTTERAETPLLLAVHGDPDLARCAEAERSGHSAYAYAARLSHHCGLSSRIRGYTSACVAASTAVADAAAMVAQGQTPRVVVAAGYLVDPDQFALFDAGRALATDGQVRPFSAGRTGLLLGDGVAAVVVESAAAARARQAPVLAHLAGWGRAGDAYHVCQPRPDGAGLARAAGLALGRAGVGPEQVGYVNAHGSGTPQSDAAEAAALRRIFGERAGEVPVSSTKSVHGQALEASALVELVVTVLALRQGQLPVNAGFLGLDEQCRLNLVADPGRPPAGRFALSLNAAFGGANTALLVGTP